jgi:hypothetical protein
MAMAMKSPKWFSHVSYTMEYSDHRCGLSSGLHNGLMVHRCSVAKGNGTFICACNNGKCSCLYRLSDGYGCDRAKFYYCSKQCACLDLPWNEIWHDGSDGHPIRWLG